MKTKRCTFCGEIKYTSLFPKRRTGGKKLRARCKKCSNFIDREKRSSCSPEHRIRRNILQRKYRKEHPEYSERNYGTGKYRFARTRYAARRHGCSWKISREMYYRLIQKPCVYCGGKIDEKGIGLDKVNPKIKSYCLSNVVPCCGRCNWIKMNWFSFSQMKKLGSVIKTFKN